MRKFLIKLSRIIYWLTPKEYKSERHHNSYKSSLEKLLIEDCAKNTLKTFGQHLKRSVLFHYTDEIRQYAIKEAVALDKEKEGFYLEFGVFAGSSTNFFSKFVKKLYAFDSFEGLVEDWAGTSSPKGKANLNKKIPKLNSNVELEIGLVQETLEDFLKKHSPKIKFVHMDLDTYESSKYVLEKIKPYLLKDAIILFDELYNFIGWESGEYKALTEVFNDDEYKFKAFTLNYSQAVIQLNQR